MKVSLRVTSTVILLGCICQAQQDYVFVSDSWKTFSEAKTYCQTQYPEGNLAAVHSEAENTEVWGLCENLGQLQAACWAGMDNPTITGQYKWHDGSPIDYTAAWYTGEPDGGSAQPCVVFRGAWHTVGYCEDGGGAALPFVCQYTPGPSTPPTTAFPTTASPTTTSPTSPPTTPSPTTAAPTTATPTTALPTTAAPTTALPTTALPTTALPTTAAPTETANTAEGEVVDNEDEDEQDEDEEEVNVDVGSFSVIGYPIWILIGVPVLLLIILCLVVACACLLCRRKRAKSVMEMTSEAVNGEENGNQNAVEAEGRGESTVNMAMPQLPRAHSPDSARHESMYRNDVARPTVTIGNTTNGSSQTTRRTRVRESDDDESSDSMFERQTAQQTQQTRTLSDGNTR